jgi:PIN domain nuclease of toxin-antitoxin system
MRYYLDTNILIYMLNRESDELSRDVVAILMDYENTFRTSTVCVHELIHLFQIGKVPLKRNGKEVDISDFSDWLYDMGIDIIPVSVKHLQKLSTLPLMDDHRDPNDRLIIAQAIADRIALISSDRKFDRYAKYGLDFIFNRR